MRNIQLTQTRIVVDDVVDAVAFLLVRTVGADAAEERSHPQTPPGIVA
jgi:hypothetical protein